MRRGGGREWKFIFIIEFPIDKNEKVTFDGMGYLRLVKTMLFVTEIGRYYMFL